MSSCPVNGLQMLAICLTESDTYSWKAALLVQDIQDAQFALDKVQHILIVHKLNVTPVDRLALILSLLHLEDMLVEMLLQLFIGQVDAQLLKVVLLELLKSCEAEKWILATKFKMSRCKSRVS